MGTWWEWMRSDLKMMGMNGNKWWWQVSDKWWQNGGKWVNGYRSWYMVVNDNSLMASVSNGKRENCDKAEDKNEMVPLVFGHTHADWGPTVGLLRVQWLTGTSCCKWMFAARKRNQKPRSVKYQNRIICDKSGLNHCGAFLNHCGVSMGNPLDKDRPVDDHPGCLGNGLTVTTPPASDRRSERMPWTCSRLDVVRSHDTSIPCLIWLMLAATGTPTAVPYVYLGLVCSSPGKTYLRWIINLPPGKKDDMK